MKKGEKVLSGAIVLRLVGVVCPECRFYGGYCGNCDGGHWDAIAVCDEVARSVGGLVWNSGDDMMVVVANDHCRWTIFEVHRAKRVDLVDYTKTLPPESV